MNNKLTFTGGEPFMTEDDFLRIQQANREFIQNFLLDYGECIVSGANTNIPTQASPDLIVSNDGFVYLDGEILKVDAGTYIHTAGTVYWRYKKVTTYESGGDKIYKDGTPRQTWQKNRAVPENITTIGAGDLDCVYGQRYNEPKIVEDWIGVTFEDDFANKGGDSPTEYKKDSLGNVWIRGSYIKPTAGALDAVVFILPTGYRPSKKIYIIQSNINNLIRGYIDTNGEFRSYSVDDTYPNRFSISFRTD